MSRKSVLGAFCSGNGALETTTRRIACRQQQHQRTFTSTASRPATHITHFTPTSSEKLDTLLNTIRHKIILPAYLPAKQRKIIYSPKHEKKLQSDPITIEIDGEVLKFRHMDPFQGDIPAARKSLIDAVSQFDAPEDFANLKPLLEGVHYTKYRLDPSVYAKIVRICGARGRIYQALECARAARTTGLRLDTSEKANEALHFVQLKALDADYDPAETARALRWADRVIDMLADPQHQPTRRKKAVRLVRGQHPLDRDPQVLLARLHLAAALAKNPPEAAEEAAEAEVEDKAAATAAAAVARIGRGALVQRVGEYAHTIVKLWPRTGDSEEGEPKKLRDLQPSELYEDENQMGYLLEANKFVTLAAPLLRGLDLAAEVLRSEADDKSAYAALAGQLEARRAVLDVEIQGARKSMSMKPKGSGEPMRGEEMYKRLFGQPGQ
ncbi:hypothetical protein SLS62_004574 [Diatrype stigma]|uniref:Uncharacterized protein n=1 Tax=Diatrype stigma TaxID=117547 RepID=A0AAN9YTB0_9PEZI